MKLNENGNSTIVFDGHDGCGKTTLAKIITNELGGIYVRPFGGVHGPRLIAAAENQDYDQVLQVGKMALTECYTKHENQRLIFDRHWMTILSLVPVRYWSSWEVCPSTILCTADLDTLMTRLNERSEKKFDVDYHLNYLGIYKQLAEFGGAFVLDTTSTSIQVCVQEIIKRLHQNNPAL